MANQTAISAVSYLENAFSGLPLKFLISVMTILIGLIVGKSVGTVLSKVLSEIELNAVMRNNFGLKVNAESILSNAASYLIYGISIIYSLDQLGLANIILHMISLAMIILIVLSLTLAIRDFFPNAVGGIVIAKKKMLNIGDTIEIDNIKGKVNKLSLIAVEVITKKGDLIYIPNSLISKKILIKKR